MNRLSACIITQNEERNLPRLLASLRAVADEVIVVDSGSTDRTEAIARESGAAFHFRRWTNYSEQRNFAASLASHNWILAMDADEELSSALQTAILDWKKRVPKFDVYEVARKTWYLGAWIKHSGWYPDFKDRLYRQGATEYAGSVHEKLQHKGPCGRLSGDLLHYTIHEFREHEANAERYSTLAARQMFEQGQRHWRGALWFATPWSFFHTFVLRGGFLDGHRGLLIARMAAKTVRLKYAKLGQLLAAERKPSEQGK
jgi:glycosyltransferase involved in cell wall biosynthesis